MLRESGVAASAPHEDPPHRVFLPFPLGGGVEACFTPVLSTKVTRESWERFLARDPPGSSWGLARESFGFRSHFHRQQECLLPGNARFLWESRP